MKINIYIDFSGVDTEVIEETVIYHSSRFPASATRTYVGAEIPYEVARFDDEGNIIEIYRVPTEEEKTIDPEIRYQHTLLAVESFFTENDISVENESKIVN